MLVNIIVSRNRVSGEMRTGVRLRLEYPPPGISYKVANETINSSKWFLKAIIEPIYSLKIKGLTHAFFLNLFIPRTPWFRKLTNQYSTSSRSTWANQGGTRYMGLL
ncbi:hypothetical protein [Vulcanisaeta sp. JCM 16159]|uniref:hypothetical protein n=1 Tax=Vulcanisaeta sp. JCM 16159 TaxID=1295371 RepID=UPI001FB2C035|nr:hypothetical protein [Vulcanisaeta sp. JCM 16159]